MNSQSLEQVPPAIVVPAPTVVVEPQVTIPSELLDRLVPPDPGLLTQPVATIIAALIALLAARIAWRGVQKQIHSTAQNVERQISAEHARHRRTERVTALAVTVELAERSHQAAREAAKARTRGTADEITACSQRLQELHDERKVMLARLQLLGMESSFGAFATFHLAINKTARSLGKPDFLQKATEMLPIKAALVDTFMGDLNVQAEGAKRAERKKRFRLPWTRQVATEGVDPIPADNPSPEETESSSRGSKPSRR
ncbi:hypothetical protein CH251_04960 [Rhodococcus sp. 06-462-5]|uniref:hypothetical protein n=1 Tax=unclassified Rhodococcus (in: high G+C Gram-positive bacteria) TaxID=192944 RepID=UPI000B9B6C8A|nr:MULTISPECIES: hypothetical protein [unclassified Rhodococcus (in: high G+C Gram-positive bacteria)]OZC78007.1 hypothetical protein CH251_04960 [Rhodococcus sp. 06-462-5]OZE61859.1 hypothetical protein CH270_19350 [Rhodococcus sp. 02-925g]